MLGKMGYCTYERHITDWDICTYRELTKTELNETERGIIHNAAKVFSTEKVILALHWHPENVPLKDIEVRINHMYPNRHTELIIPTQHNQILSYKGYCGVEIDCYAEEFKRKVQLLAHFSEDRLESAHTLKFMLDRTYAYRRSQLYEFIDSICQARYRERLERAAAHVAADEALVEFVKIYTNKLKILLEKYYDDTPLLMIRNKLVTNYFERLNAHFDNALVDRALCLLKQVKQLVKRNFVEDYFYSVNEIIEEIRGLKGGVIVPHPEQFWPILLADYDVDGYEVWNPQSREFTEFIIQVILNKNKQSPFRERNILITMGDDTHMGEKIKDSRYQNHEKASREIAYQPAWNDHNIQEILAKANFHKERIIQEYVSRIH